MKNLILLALLFIGSVHGQSIDSLIQDYVENGHNYSTRMPFNGAVLVAKKNQIKFKKAYGFYNRKQKTELQIENKFPIGSLTMQFTAMLVLQEVEKGTLDLDRTVSEYLHYFPKEMGTRLTVHQLLSHSSGLPSERIFIQKGHTEDSYYGKPMTPKEHAQLISTIEIQKQDIFQFSSLNYILLGAILEEITGKTYQDLLHTQIIKPLGLKNTGCATNAIRENDVSKTYLFQKHGLFNSVFKNGKGIYKSAPFGDQLNAYSANGMYSTLDDLYTWVRAVQSSRLLSPKLTQKMFSANQNGYAYGWHRNPVRMLRANIDAPLFTQYGQHPNYGSSISIYDDGTVVILLTNVDRMYNVGILRGIHLTANTQNPNTYTNRINRPSLTKGIDEFKTQGGFTAYKKYYEELTRIAGYQIHPTAYALLELVELHGNKADIERIVTDHLQSGIEPIQNGINRLGYELIKYGLFDLAIQVFLINVQHYPNDANSYDSLGEGYFALKKYTLAKTHFEKAVALGKNHESYDVFKEHLEEVNRLLN